MTKIITNKSIIVTVLAIAFLAALTAETSAQRTRGAMPRSRGAQNIDGATQSLNRQQAATQEIQKAAQDLDTTLVGILEMVNQQQKPAAQDLEDSNTVATAAKKHAKQFNEEMQCELFMLMAWNSYFEEDIKSAALNATQAYKTDQTNNDAHATQTAIAILADRKPLVIAPPRQRPTARNQTPGQSEYGRTPPQNTRMRTPRTQNTPGASNINMNATSGNILQFDPDAVDISMIGKTVTPMKLTCINSTSMEYNPSQANLCIMFWQIESENQPAEPNDPSARPARTNPNDPYSRQPQPGYNQQNYREQGRGEYGRGDYGRGDYGRDAYAPGGRGYGQTPGRQNADPLISQMEAYGNIFQTRVTNPQVKFVAINTNAISDTPEVIEKMLQNPWPWANVMAASPASGASQFADTAATVPMLAIVDRAGTIKYAGPAEGFLAPMVIDYLTDQPAPTAPLTSSILNPLKTLTSNTPTPTRTTPPQTTLNISNQDTDEITPDDYQAGKLLEYARAFVPMGRKPILTSKLGIDTCRQIIKDYPQSTYAQEARMLLRSVPEYERKRYKITDAEMGL